MCHDVAHDPCIIGRKWAANLQLRLVGGAKVRDLYNSAGDGGRLEFLKYALEHAMSSVPYTFCLFRSDFACTLLKAKNAPLRT